MSLAKVSRGDHIDHLSELPDNVIDVILQHLPIGDAVRTSILSRKWRHKWISVPQLEFGEDFFQDCKHIRNIEIPSIITEVLLIHNGPLSNFYLEIPSGYLVRIKCLYKWIQFLSKSGIKDLELFNNQRDSYQMPSYLFSCQALSCLRLDHFDLSLPPNFKGFKSLCELCLSNVKFESNALDSLISGCPLLKELSISYCSGFDSINVSAPILEYLWIQDDRVIKSICYEKANNLTEMILLIIPWEKMNQLNISDFVEGLPKIERLSLGEGYIKCLSAGIIPHTLPKTINSLKYLELYGVDFNLSRELLFLFCLLRGSPNLGELCLTSCTVTEAPVQDHVKALDYNNCCLSELQEVNIEVKKADEPAAMDLTRFLLANSPSLKNLTFKVGFVPEKSDVPTLLRISRDLYQMERASQRAQVKFLYEGLNE